MAASQNQGRLFDVSELLRNSLRVLRIQATEVAGQCALAGFACPWRDQRLQGLVVEQLALVHALRQEPAQHGVEFLELHGGRGARILTRFEFRYRPGVEAHAAGQNEFCDPLRVVDGQQLGDATADVMPDDIGPRHAQCVEQAHHQATLRCDRDVGVR